MGYLLDFQQDFVLNIIHRVKLMPQTGKNKLECLFGKNGLNIFSNYNSYLNKKGSKIELTHLRSNLKNIKRAKNSFFFKISSI
jgi:hypothetical protein